MIISMSDLGLATRFYNIDLRRDSVRRAKPCVTYEREPGVGVVFDKRSGVRMAVFAEGVPDSVTVTGAGEMVAFAR